MSEIAALKNTLVTDVLAGTGVSAVFSTRVYDEVSPQPVVFPYVRIRVQEGRSRTGAYGQKVLERFGLFVESIFEVDAATPSHKACQDGYDLIDPVVRASMGTVGDDQVRGFVQEGTYQFYEHGEGGRLYSVCGARFTGYAYSIAD